MHARSTLLEIDTLRVPLEDALLRFDPTEIEQWLDGSRIHPFDVRNGSR